ncbi:MAG TPA: hypothetical protein VMK12_25735 [Anaeromyxobacteraceae bacterium]|nr:hypothetical protein [Anaeromyxobacteraceae bacterium]
MSVVLERRASVELSIQGKFGLISVDTLELSPDNAYLVRIIDPRAEAERALLRSTGQAADQDDELEHPYVYGGTE